MRTLVLLLVLLVMIVGGRMRCVHRSDASFVQQHLKVLHAAFIKITFLTKLSGRLVSQQLFELQCGCQRGFWASMRGSTHSPFVNVGLLDLFEMLDVIGGAVEDDGFVGLFGMRGEVAGGRYAGGVSTVLGR